MGRLKTVKREGHPLVKEAEERVLYLDIIRAAAICLIIIFHFNTHALALGVTTSAIFWETSFGGGHGFLGNIGVSLFITLSGASLMLSTRGGFDAKAFYKKRFLSIYPLFWLTYAVTFLALLLLHRNIPAQAQPWTFLLTIAGLDGFLSYAIPNFYLLGEWFLGFIIIMYIFFPFLRYLFLEYPLFAGLLCLCITLTVGKYYNLTMTVDRFPLFRISEFMFGMVFIYLFRPSHKAMNLLLFGMAGLLFYRSFPYGLPHPFGLVVQGLCIFVCLACVSELFNEVLFARAIRFVSAHSYGAFLVHHVLLIQVLPLFKDRHMGIFNSYSLFFLLLIFIYGLSFLLTNISIILRRLVASKLVLWRIRGNETA